MPTQSRIENSTRNMTFAMISQIVTIVLNLASRAVFVRVLSAEYMGLSGLFSNILGLLSLAELGIGTAITYSLYAPIKNDDHEKIKSYMRLYKLTYWIIGAFIFVVGLALTPFIDVFIKERPGVPYLELIFILFVVQSSSTYFFSYKTNFFTATQHDYILQKYKILFSLLQIILQIVYLLVFKEYFGYLIIGILFPFINNVYASIKVDEKYPYLKEKAQSLTSEELKPVKKNVFALFLYKIAQKLSATIDTLIVSKFMGIIEVAIYYNYHFILTFADLFFIRILGAITPSLGNLLVSDDNDKKVKTFGTIQFIYYWVGTYMGVGFIVLFNTFVTIWLGPDYLFSQDIVIALAISSTLTNFQRPCSLMRDAGGLFWYGKLRPLATMSINIVASILFVRWFGTIGVVVGTILSKLLTYTWYDPYIVYKHAIKASLRKYFVKYAFHWGLFAVFALLCDQLYKLTNFTGLLGLIVGFVFVTIIVNGGFIILYRKSYDYQYLKENVIGRLFNKIKNR